MKIELLKTFLEVSRTLHFRIASENLYITQSAVSARIKLLEDELGVLLFDRSRKHLKLTPEGHRLIKHANEFIFLWQKTKHDIGIAENHNQQLVVGAMISIWDMVLQDWLNQVGNSLENVSLFTNTYGPVELRKNLLNGAVDIAFLFEPPFVEELISEHVTTVPLHLVTTDLNKTLENVNLDNYVMVDYGDSVNAQHSREFKDAPPARHFMSQPRVALNFILDSGGSAYLPQQMINEFVDKKELYVVDNAPVYSRDIFAIYLARNQKLDLIEQAIKLFPHATI